MRGLYWLHDTGKPSRAVCFWLKSSPGNYSSLQVHFLIPSKILYITLTRSYFKMLIRLSLSPLKSSVAWNEPRTRPHFLMVFKPLHELVWTLFMVSAFSPPLLKQGFPHSRRRSSAIVFLVTFLQPEVPQHSFHVPHKSHLSPRPFLTIPLGEILYSFARPSPFFYRKAVEDRKRSGVLDSEQAVWAWVWSLPPAKLPGLTYFNSALQLLWLWWEDNRSLCFMGSPQRQKHGSHWSSQYQSISDLL